MVPILCCQEQKAYDPREKPAILRSKELSIEFSRKADGKSFRSPLWPNRVLLRVRPQHEYGHGLIFAAILGVMQSSRER
jgi:hypothetical protein